MEFYGRRFCVLVREFLISCIGTFLFILFSANSWTVCRVVRFVHFCCVAFLRKYACLAVYVPPVLSPVRNFNTCYVTDSPSF